MKIQSHADLKKLKKAIKNAENRAKEKLEERANRLKKQLEWYNKNKNKVSKKQAIKRLKENNIERMVRLSILSENQKKRLEKETPEKRKSRLEILKKNKEIILNKEEPEVRKVRLERLKKNQEKRRNQEEPGARKVRLETLKESQQKRLNEEEPEARKVRLERLKKNQEKRLNQEEPEARKVRLERLKKNQEKRLNQEESEARKVRLETLQKNQAKRLNEEEAKAREVRLETLKKNQIKRIHEETLEVRKVRLETLKKNQKNRLSKETIEERIIRLENYRNRYNNYKTFSFEQFLEEINDLGGYTCEVCRRKGYLKQFALMQKTQIKVCMPDQKLKDFQDKFIVCHRCKARLTSNTKLPSQIYWNNLDPGVIPDELKVLTPIEARLISRCIPFMKIIKLKGKFGQYGLKGQAILFAQDVNEIGDQILNVLPRPMNSLGIVVVVEKREKVLYEKEFEVSEKRLQKALKWLIENNQLYKDLKLDTDNFKVDYSQIIVEAKRNNEEESNTVYNDWKQIFYKKTKVKAKILHCSRHLFERTFGEYAGKQMLSMAVASLAKCILKPLEFWDQIDLETVLDEGHALHVSSVNALGSYATNNNGFIDFLSLIKEYTIFGQKYTFYFQDFEFGKNMFEISKFNDEIKKFFEINSVGIVAYENQYLSLIKSENKYYLFDPRPRGDKGGPTKKNKNGQYNGNAIVLEFINLNEFITKLKSQLGCKKGCFSLTFCQISLLDDVCEVLGTFGSKTPELFTNPELKENDLRLKGNLVSKGNIGEIVKNIISNSSQKLQLSLEQVSATETERINSIKIIHGNWNQSNSKYGKYSGMQCTAMAAAAIITSVICQLETWTEYTINDILNIGNRLFEESLINLENASSDDIHPRYICADELKRKVFAFGKNFQLDISYNTFVGGSIFNLLELVNTFFNKKNYHKAIFTCQSKSYAIIKISEDYWLFDSHSCNEQGYTAFDGRACVICLNFQGLIMHLQSRIDFNRLDEMNSTLMLYSLDITYDSNRLTNGDDSAQDIQNTKHRIPPLERKIENLKKYKFENIQTAIKIKEENVEEFIDSDSDNNSDISCSRNINKRCYFLLDSDIEIVECDQHGDPIDQRKAAESLMYRVSDLNGTLTAVMSHERYNNVLEQITEDTENVELLDPFEMDYWLPEEKCDNCDAICDSCCNKMVYLQFGHISDEMKMLIDHANNGQDIAMSVVAFLRIEIEPISCWSREDIDNAMWCGNQLYDSVGENLTYLRKLNLYGRRFEIEIEGFSINTTKNLDYVMKGFFEKFHQSYGLFTVGSRTYALMFIETMYIIFDPHACSNDGTPCNIGIPCIIATKSYEKFIVHLMFRINKDEEILDDENENIFILKQFSIINLKIEDDKPLWTVTNEAKIIKTNYDFDISGPVTVMRPKDAMIPRANDFFTTNNTNFDIDAENVPIKNLIRKTKPPVSTYLEKRHEELCFPILFPYGKNGVNETREIPMSTLEYFQSRIRSGEQRFCSRDYLCYAVSMVESARVSDTISICGKLRQGNVKINNVASNLHLIMRKVRGSSAYWSLALLDLLSMVKILGPGTAFLTLSCNDLNWNDVIKACLKAEGKEHVDLSELSIEEKQRLIENHPREISEKFHIRIQNLVRLLKTGDLTDGYKMIDYWFRIEFQQRGSPHCHMIIWLENFPKLNTVEGIEAMEKLCKCEVPLNDEQLAELVRRNQIHRHSHTCYKRGGKTCRFNFPRAECRETKILELDSSEFIRNGHRIVQMKRAKGNEFVNNYVPIILKIWKGNMDFQFITTQSIVHYVAKYTCKSETEWINAVMTNAMKEAIESNLDMRKKLYKLTGKILNEREVSCCECIYRLCHLPLKGSSREVVFVNTSKPAERFMMLRVEMENPQENSYYINVIDRYKLRPEKLKHLSLGEFASIFKPYYRKKQDVTVQNEEDGAEEYDAENDNDLDEFSLLFKRPKLAVYKLKDGKTEIQRRKKPAVLRTRYFSPTGDRINYFYSLLLLHLPFVDEKEILRKLDSTEYYEENETENAFYDKHHLMRPLRQDCTVEEYRENATEINNAVLQIRALLDANGDHVENVDEPVNEDIIRETPADEFIDMELDPEVPIEPQIENVKPKKLNSDQHKVFKLLQEWIRKDIAQAKQPAIRMFITGSAGTGKSFLIDRTVNLVNSAYTLIYPCSKVIFITAPTGVAARLIKGQTLHSALALGIEHGEVTKYKPLTGNYLATKRKEWANVRFLIIDEISMVSYEMLKCIEQRLRQLKYDESDPQSLTAFGGINVLVFGDLLQLPPVMGNPVYKQPYNTAEVFLWRTYFDFFELKQNMRQKDDLLFVDLLNAMRFGELDTSQIKLLMSRVENEGLSRTGIFADENTTLIAPVTRIVDNHNLKVLTKLTTATKENPNPPKSYIFTAQDRLVENNKGVINPDISKVVPEDVKKTAGIPKEIELAVGARVMLRRNINVATGLVNGALGVINSFKWPNFRMDQLEHGELPEAVIIQFDNIGESEIRPTCFTFNAKAGFGKVERRQLPIILAWAVTAHKLQGVTVQSAVLDIGPEVFAKGQAYVMMSRPTSLDKILILRSFRLQKILGKYVNDEAVNEMKRLRRLNEVSWEEFLNDREEFDLRKQLK